MLPFIRVELYRGRTVEQKRAFVEAVTRATVETLGAKPEAVRIRFDELDAEDLGWAGEYPAKR